MMLKINTNFRKGIGWSFAIFTVLGLFSYLTFIPRQTFAESLIVDPDEKRSLSDISTMQEISQQICINSPENETEQLTDTRDQKKYWVTKLKDGNCWMTQNLDFDLNLNWPYSNDTLTVVTSIGGDGKCMDTGGNIEYCTKWKDDNIAIQYHDPGTYYYNGPSNNHAQGTNCTNTTGLSGCNQFSTSGTDDHYSIGNYYSWNAATNGTGGSITSGEASGSICPEGWKLPTSNNTNNGSFAYLLTQYGVQSSLTSDGYAIYDSPLYFVYGGGLYSGQLYVAGSYGYYWPSTPASNAASVYSLSFASSVNPSNLYTRDYGYSIRCLAEGGWLDSYPELLDDNQANVSITVSPVISIDVTKHADDMTVDFTQVARSSIIARVGSNQGYQVLISTEQSNLEQSPVVENQHIPMITTDQKISAGNKAWGISKDITVVSSTGTTISNPTISTNTIYSPIGLGENKALFYTSNTPASEDLTFPVAIAVDSTLPSGQYSTQVTLTAVAM